ncbi:hypothetical protein GGR54DRAFT_636380 [Hypoxylon sp. NC1633]|nr:hypothetical protein GGR54DRAFT_636380 [Hypoxylon sp. NC1633]
MAHSQVVNQGLTQVYTGLGILLGAGRISSTTHEQVLALINGDQGANAVENVKVDLKESPAVFPRPGKETPVSIQSHDLLGIGTDLSELSIAEKPSRDTEKPAPPPKGPHGKWRRLSMETPKAPYPPKIICPWWSTEGFHCRDHERGLCSMYHEDIPDGLKDHLICHFWADGGRCTKSEATCRFAHYPAQHRIVAPLPAKKKNKKSRSAYMADGDHDDWHSGSRGGYANQGNDAEDEQHWAPQQSHHQHDTQW